LRLGDERAKCLPRRRDLREVGSGREGRFWRQHTHALLQPLPLSASQILAFGIPATGRLLDRAEPAVGMSWNLCIRDPSCSIAIVREGRALAPVAQQRKPFEHRINNQFIEVREDVMLVRVDRNDSMDRIAGMFDSVRPESAGREDLERLAVKEGRARIFCLFVEIVPQSLQTVLQVLPAIRRLHLQT